MKKTECVYILYIIDKIYVCTHKNGDLSNKIKVLHNCSLIC
uniref:Uncharacterized protein n=1 Tax=Anguilla anguilla TaxID=7936 RepID=A0A0E9S4H3_ANGAN